MHRVFWVSLGPANLILSESRLKHALPLFEGRNLGSRYEGTFAGSFSIGSCQGKTGNGSTFSASFKQYLRRFWEAQVSAYEANGSGWIMWTWKTETADEWSYQKGVEYGWM